MARRSHEETKGGDGVEVVERNPIEEDGNKGVEVHRIYHIKAHAPSFLRWAIPEKYAHIHEINRNAFPHFDVKFSIPCMGSDFELTNESRHIPYKKGDEIPENILGLPENELSIRRVAYLDLLNGPKTSMGNYDCHGLNFPEANIHEMIGPQGISDDTKPPEWISHYDGPITLCVKAIRINFKWFGLQATVESYVTKNTFYDIFLGSYRAMYTWVPDWYWMDDESLEKYELEAKEKCNSHEFDKDNKELPQKQ